MGFLLSHALMVILISQTQFSFGWEDENQRCVPNEISMCKNSGWTYMWLPNHLKHVTKDEVEMELFHWKPLIDYKCHEHLKLFLCSMYAPVCPKTATEEDREKTEKVKIFPCQSLCQSVRNKCESVMNLHKFQWPENIFNCSTFPDESTNLCISSKLVSENSTRPVDTTRQPVTVIPNVTPATSLKCACKVSDSKADAIKAYCASDFVMRAKIAEKKQTGINLMLRVRPTKTVKGKKGKKERNNLRVYIVGGGSDHCDCTEVSPSKKRQWLIMGVKLGKPHSVTYITRKKKIMKKILSHPPNCS